MGNLAAQYNAAALTFKGQRILEATIGYLQLAFGLGAAPYSNPKVLLAGSRAGALGVLANLEYVATFLPPGAQLKGFLDGGMTLEETAPLAPALVPFVNQTTAAIPFFNASGRMGPLCATLFFGLYEYKCLVAQFRLPTLRLAYLASAPQFDPVQLVPLEGAPPPYVGPALGYADLFQRTQRSFALTLPGAQQSGSAVYSSACYKGPTSLSGEFWGVKVGDISLARYLSEWALGGPLGNTPQVIEACVGFGCGQCHRPSALAAPPLPPARAGLYNPPAPVYSPPGLSVRLAAKRNSLPITPAHLAALAALLLLISLVLCSNAARATRSLSDAAAYGSFEAREAAPLLRPASPFRAPRAAPKARAPPAGMKVSKVAGVRTGES